MWDLESNNENYHNALLTADCGTYSLLWNQDSNMSVQTLSIWSAWPQSQGYLTFRKENKHLPHDPGFLTFNSAERDIIHAGKLLTNRNNFFKSESRSRLSLESFNNFFFWWQIRTVDIYQHAQRQNRAGHLSFSPVLLPEFHDSHKILIPFSKENSSFIPRQKMHVKQTENHHKLTL